MWIFLKVLIQSSLTSAEKTPMGFGLGPKKNKKQPTNKKTRHHNTGNQTKGQFFKGGHGYSSKKFMCACINWHVRHGITQFALVPREFCQCSHSTGNLAANVPKFCSVCSLADKFWLPGPIIFWNKWLTVSKDTHWTHRQFKNCLRNSYKTGKLVMVSSCFQL